MRKWLREPLVHFLLGGLALFVLYGRVAPEDDGVDRIVVNEDRVRMLVQSFERTWMRPPSEAELQGLIDDYVVEEVLYREALALGLDRDDLIVRRRMRQKMEFLNDGLAEREPDEETLRTFLDANPERFRIPARLTFVQVFLDPDAAGSVQERAAALLARLRAGEDAEALGDATLLPSGLTGATPAQVGSSFGAPFAEALAEAPVGEWSGPLASSFGLHLVRVAEREPSRLPALGDVRGVVEREWAAEERKEARERFYEALRSRYQVEVRMPDGAAPAEVASEP
jgi:hypothetical protein